MFLPLKQWTYISLLSCALTTIGYVCDVRHDDSDKENMRPLCHSLAALELDKDKDQFQTLQAQLSNLQISIEQGHNQANPKQLFQCYRDFADQLQPHYSESLWQQVATARQAECWPIQKNWSEVVGGHLFFPSGRLYKWIGSEYTEHLINRIDMLSAYAIASKFNHPLGYYYLGEQFYLLNDVGPSEHFEDNSLTFRIFFDRSFPTLNVYLKHQTKHDDVIFAVARYRAKLSTKTACYPYNKDRADDLLKTSSDFRNQFALLKLKARWSACYPAPTFDDYLILARQGYPAAYEEALKLADDQQFEQLFPEALQAGCLPALIRKGDHEMDQERLNAAKHYFNQAQQAGLAHGSIDWALENIDDIVSFDLERMENFNNNTPQQIQEAIEALTAAGQMHDPLAWELLGNLYYKLMRKAEQNDQNEMVLRYTELAAQAWDAGCMLGWHKCYYNIWKQGDRYAYYNNYPEFFKTKHQFESDIFLAQKFLNFIDKDQLDDIFQ